MPVRRLRTGKLRDATLPELAQWGREHPEAQKIAATTINKLLGGVQAVGRWARSADLVTDDWSDPFADIRIDAEESKRAPLETKELQAIFNTPVFTDGERPEGGQGEAAFWLPLLALFTGACEFAKSSPGLSGHRSNHAPEPAGRNAPAVPI
jgi:hypothetical protein